MSGLFEIFRVLLGSKIHVNLNLWFTIKLTYDLSPIFPFVWSTFHTNFICFTLSGRNTPLYLAYLFQNFAMPKLSLFLEPYVFQNKILNIKKVKYSTYKKNHAMHKTCRAAYAACLRKPHGDFHVICCGNVDITI